MPMLGSVTKQPTEIENYAIYYGKDVDVGDDLTVLSITPTFVGDVDTQVLPVIDSYLIDAAGQRVKMFISGGTAGYSYKITTRVQTDSGRILEDEFKLKIKDY